MNVFTEVYEKSRTLLSAPSLHADWVEIEAGIKQLLQADGPAVDKAEALEKLRGQLRAAAKKTGGVSAKAKAKEILRVSQTDKNGFQDRAALIKQMRHFYMVAKKGGQSIWVVDVPKSYGKWNYDLYSGKSAEEVGSLLAKGDEFFGAGNRRMLSDALQLARKWSADTEVKLGGKSAATLAAVRRWFHREGDTEAAVEATRQTLVDGFKKITAACNSGKVIFSDRPHLRASGDYDNTYASVNAGDAMAVIYIYQLFLKTGRRRIDGKIPKLWLCALTVIHELTHKLQSTQDIRYDYQGLLPSDSFPSTDAIRNADSWAYFCGDVLGNVPRSAVTEALT
ncbi:M35 family metallo-endopeptidase [Pseudorhodoferax sp.]|uniref:M35 family metallo-endopeptidase n=1 Tax=Pseudorhodoferax sp. TaxID=1993553 RepID=UPI002DD6856F|nr:M35 family metallo-endopeptidase [Pseudorhodoferax sp.]